MELNIDLGLKSYDIRLPDGTLTGTVRFNLADPGIAARWKKVQPEVNSLTEKAHNAEEDTILDVLQEADERIKSCIDYAFGAKVSEVFFGGQSCFGVCGDGATVLEHVLDAIGPVIEASMQAGAKAVRSRAEAHTAPYDGTAKGLAPGQVLPG